MMVRVTAMGMLVPWVVRAERPLLRAERWSGLLNVPDPVACSVDDLGRVYVTRTARRKTADLDIRQWSEWIADDVGLTSVEAKRAFLRERLATGVLRGPRGDLRDWNGDGVVDWNDLTVPAESVVRLEDRDGDGRADWMGEYAGGFASEVTGIAAGVLAADGAVFATIAPDLWRMEDRDGDGKAEVRRSLVHGFGIHLAYAGHDMHGLRRGPDGRIYWSIGDKGVEVTRADGRRFSYPHEGCVLRCEVDGSGFEVYAHGLRNVQEIAFNETGDVFGVDNDADKPGEKERLVWILPESDAGWRCSWQYMTDWCPWMGEGRWKPAHAGQPLFLTPPLAESHDGPSGFAWNPGTALSAEWAGWFFVNQFPSGNMNALRLEREGAGWRLAEDVRVSRGIMGVGMSWGPDGGLYYADWESGYELNGKGAVWRVDVESGRGHPLRGEVRQLLADGFGKRGEGELAGLLVHEDQRVRCGAQWALAERGAWAVLREAAVSGKERLGRLHGIWGLGQGWRSGRLRDVAVLAGLMRDGDAWVRALAARVASESPVDGEAGAALVGLLGDGSLPVRLEAALACGRVKPAGAVEGLLRMAGEDGGPFLRHAVVTGLAGCADSGRLAGMREDGSAGRRAAAVLALGRQRDAGVAVFLGDGDPRIAEAAAIAIYDGEGIEAALPALGDWLGKAGAGAPESMVRRAMGSLARRGDGVAAAGLAEYVLREGVPVRLRRAGLELLGQWTSVPRLDPADGFVRVQGRRDGEAAVMALRPLLPRLLELKEPELQAGVLGMALSLRLPVPAERLAVASGDGSLTAAVRVAALGLLVADHREDGRTRPAVEMALRGKEEMLAVAALKALEGLDAAGAVERAAELVRGGGGVRLRQEACGLLGRVGRAEAAARLGELLAGEVPGELLLDVWEAAGKYPALSGALEKSRVVVEGAAAGVAWRDCLSGGDAESGKRIVLTDVAANCVACHRFGAEPGSAVGPALLGIGAERTAAELVEALVNPGAVVADGYGIVTATLGDGTVVGGVLVSQDAREVVIRLPEGGERRLGRETVKEMTAPVSVMPPMEAILTRREIRDVVAYLGTLKAGKGAKGGKGEKGGKR